MLFIKILINNIIAPAKKYDDLEREVQLDAKGMYILNLCNGSSSTRNN
jgi:hypothetical protein